MLGTLFFTEVALCLAAEEVRVWWANNLRASERQSREVEWALRLPGDIPGASRTTRLHAM